MTGGWGWGGEGVLDNAWGQREKNEGKRRFSAVWRFFHRKDLKVVCHPMMRINIVRKTLVGSSWEIYVRFMLLARYQYSPSFEELLPQPVFYYVTSSYSVTRKSVLPRSLLLNAPAPFVIVVGGGETLFICPHRYTALGFRWWITSLLHC